MLRFFFKKKKTLYPNSQFIHLYTKKYKNEKIVNYTNKTNIYLNIY